jgi:hypothetical protein
MILVFVVFVWIVVLSVVVGLCVAAGIGDRAQLASARHSSEQRPQIYARPSVRPAESHGSVLDCAVAAFTKSSRRRRAAARPCVGSNERGAAGGPV